MHAGVYAYLLAYMRIGHKRMRMYDTHLRPCVRAYLRAIMRVFGIYRMRFLRREITVFPPCFIRNLKNVASDLYKDKYRRPTAEMEKKR